MDEANFDKLLDRAKDYAKKKSAVLENLEFKKQKYLRDSERLEYEIGKLEDWGIAGDIQHHDVIFLLSKTLRDQVVFETGFRLLAALHYCRKEIKLLEEKIQAYKPGEEKEDG